MKDNKVNYHLLLKLILPAGLLLCFTAYQLAFKKTVESYLTYTILKDAASEEDPLSVSPAYSAVREARIDTLYNRYRVDSLSWKNQLWNHCAVLSREYDCTVQGFPAWTHLASGSYTLLKQEVTFNGNYFNLLRLQRAMDTLKNVGLTGALSYIRNQRDQYTTLKLQLFGLQREER
ncbi:MAG TPA: hypothetical protein VKB19_19770 [Pedobacter sp.]|nr:hypothetical protein [Pedobacter sp.]